MTKTFLIATVAALAITAPAQADRGGNKNGGDRQDARAQRNQGGGGEQRQARQQQRQQPQRQQPQRMERPQFQQQVRMERPQFQQRERPQRQQQVRMERPQFQQRERPQRQQQVRMERPQRQQQMQAQRFARQNRAVEQRSAGIRQVQQHQIQQRQAQRQLQQHQIEQRQAQRQNQQHQIQQRQAQRQDQQRQFGQRQAQRQLQQQRQQADNRFNRQQLRQPDRQAERQDARFAMQQQRAQQQFDRRQAFGDQRAMRAEFRQQRQVRPQATIGQRFNLNNRQPNRDWYNNYAQQRGQVFYGANPAYAYNYNASDGYLYQVNRNNNLVTGLYPLLGGAFAVGRPLPVGYDNFNLPYGYRSVYYDTPDYYYRYGDGAIYRVDRSTQLIETVAALLTGQSLGIGQQLPMGYDVYNVPYAYRDQYRDSSSMWYRYDDGMIYGVDPYSRMIQSAYPVSYGYTVGYPVPAYGSYGGYNDYGYGGYGGYDNSGYGGAYSYAGYGVPYDYRDLYYAAPGYNYQYANGGIYQVDPKTQLVSALVGLVTGSTLGVGQPLPVGYDVYNVPYAYRSSYYDTADAWYRYDDGYIYQVDPRTRIVQGSIPIAANGYAVGYPMPAYAGYSVPSAYSDLYVAQPGYDYRYSNGGIYQVDSRTQMVSGVAALLTGNNLGVGQRLPVGYDVYNVPIAYRDRYQDTPDTWYRYNDGNIYRVDPQTRLIQAVINGIV